MLLGLVVVFVFSAYLRLSGITWGIESVTGIRLGSSEGKPGYGHYLSFHPDEFISIRGMSAISLLSGKLKAPDAYFEGTFNYYLWAVPRMVADLYHGDKPADRQSITGSQFKFILLSGRLMSVAFDLITLLLLFVIIRDLTNQQLPALLGAFLYGIFPIQVIYSHFMRTYTLANLLCVLVIWLSLKALKHRHWWLFLLTGMSAGLAAATRYPAALILCVPCGLILFQGNASEGSWPQRLGKSFVYLLSGPLWLLACGFVVGVFIGEPMLLFDFRDVANAIRIEASQYAPPGARNPFDLTPIWNYISVLIPYATYPVLWVLICFSTLYVVLRPSLWPTVIPLLLFATLYTYVMAKGYLDLYARLTMLLLPVLCIFVGLASGDIFPKILNRPRLLLPAMAVLIVLIAPTILFDWSYDRAMKRRDVRELVRNDMRNLIKDRPTTTIAVSDQGCFFYTSMPAVLPLKTKKNKVAVEVDSSLTTPADFFVIGFERPLLENSYNSEVRKVENGGVFRLLKGYSRAPTVFGKTFDLSNFPVDMTYPFPVILLFRKAADSYQSVEKVSQIRLGASPLSVASGAGFSPRLQKTN